MRAPFVEHAQQELAPIVGVDAPFGYHRIRMPGACPRIVSRRKVALLPTSRGDLFELSRFDTGYELHEAGFHIVAQKAIHLEWLPGIASVHGRERAEGHAVLLQQPGCSEGLIEGRFALFGEAIGVVQLARTIETQPDEELVLGKEGTPFVIEQSPVGLDVVGDTTAGRRMLSLQLNDLAKKRKAQNRRLTAMPSENDLLNILSIHVLDNEAFKGVVLNALSIPLLLKQRFLAEIVAVRAAEIASRANRFDGRVKSALDSAGALALTGV